MDTEKSLLLLHLKTDLREVLKLAREKSHELVVAMYSESAQVKDKTEELEYYISSLLDLTREIRNLFLSAEGNIHFPSIPLNAEIEQFGQLLGKVSSGKDAESLRGLLRTLEDKEYYELCARVSELLRAGLANPGRDRSILPEP